MAVDAAYGAGEVTDLRADLGDTQDKWETEALQALLNRAARKLPAGTPQQWVDVAAAMGLAQLLSSAARFNDYVIAEEQQKKSDIFRGMNAAYQNKLALNHVRVALGLSGGDIDAVIIVKLGYTRTREAGDEFARY